MLKVVVAVILVGFLLGLGVGASFDSASADSPCQLGQFENTTELREFLERSRTEMVVPMKADKDGFIRFNERCEDFALALVGYARSQGKDVHFTVIANDFYQKFYHNALPVGVYHACNVTIIGNEVYLIDPATKQFWLLAYLN